MNKRYVPAATTFLAAVMLTAAVSAQTNDETTPSTGISKVRIVRLSEVKGIVHVDRSAGKGFEAAMTNLPIVEQNRLRTDTGVAEVEFEDNSTLRLGPDSLVEFPQLERLSTGPTISSVHLLKGTAYVSLVKSQGNQFNLTFGQQTLALPPATHIRLQIVGDEAKLAVLDGVVHIDSTSGAIDVPKKKMATFSLLEQNQPLIAKDVSADPLDSWDKEAAGYHARTATMSAFNSSPYAYGVNDMMYYGSFVDAGSCGSMWRPYFASAAWDPYSNGAYAWYPGAGYSWVSPYPWAWTPFHYGSWTNCPGAGWGWQPGGTWSGLNNIAGMRKYGNIVPPPVHPPAPGAPTMTAVNAKPLVRSEIASPEAFLFRKDSAGMGIPRNTLGKLDKLSRTTESRGVASAPIYMSMAPSNGAIGRLNSAGVSVTSIHRGYAASSDAQLGSSNVGAARSGGASNSSMGSVSASNAHASGSSGHAH